MKTIERAHMPNKLWERVKLPRNYGKALELIDKHLVFYFSLQFHMVFVYSSSKFLEDTSCLIYIYLVLTDVLAEVACSQNKAASH